jgi:hypothetical protein
VWIAGQDDQPSRPEAVRRLVARVIAGEPAPAKPRGPAKRRMNAWPFGASRAFSYDVIVVDPPWDFENYIAAGTKKGADPHYDVMALDAIKALPLGHRARRDAIICLWSPARCCARPSMCLTHGVRSTCLKSYGGR